MISTRKNFISNNQTFICKNCGKKVKKHPTSSRNHCTYCLFSLHIDRDVPGDRKEKCLGLMEPLNVEYKHQSFIIIHKCNKCEKMSKNVTAQDDDMDEIIKLSKKSNLINPICIC